MPRQVGLRCPEVARRRVTGSARPRRPCPPRGRARALARSPSWLAGLGLGTVIALTITARPASQLSAPGGLLTFAGSLTGMVGTYLALIMVLLVSRIPLVERVVGQDGLVRWHRRSRPWPISLLAAHALLLTLGYAEAARTGFGTRRASLITNYPDVLTATVGLGIMCLIGVISVRAIRQRLPRETWWLIHLWMYLALALVVRARDRARARPSSGTR